jgi:acyl-homoserine lactone synthase
MLKAIIGARRAGTVGVMEQIWRFRHAQFVERLGWEDIRRADGREIDEFDTERAIHLPLLDDEQVIGYSRLLPTTEPHLLSDIYPELMEGREWPRGQTIYEWTRCIAAENALPIEGVPASNVLVTAVVEYCLAASISALVVETHPKLVNLLISTGWEVMPLAAPAKFQDHLIVPIIAKPSVKTLFTHHQTYGINGSLLDLDGSEENPIRARETLRQLPYLQHGHMNNEQIQRRRAS